jgi:hypothetical protein
VVSILNAHGPWCLIGGLAVNCYVEPVFTLDADVVVYAAARPAIKAELLKAGFLVEEFTHSLHAQMPGSDLRIQYSLDVRYQEFLKDKTIRDVLDQSVPVASLQNVVQGKVWAWSDAQRPLSKRKKDEFDVIRIAEKYPETRPLMPDEIRHQLGQD